MYKKAIFLSLIALLVGVITPRPASACIWNASHKFSPLPPCKWDDIPGRRRVNQLNTQILAKITSGAEKIIWVKREIKEWQRAYETAQQFKDKIQGVWGEVTVNPLPSLVAEFNASSPLGQYVRLENGEFSLVITPSDLPRMSDSVYQKFKEDIGVSTFLSLPEDYGRFALHEAKSTATMSVGMAKNIIDHKQYVRVIADSLQRTGNSISSRYSISPEAGISEARISRMSASLSKLRGTAFEAQARSISSRLDSFNDALDQREQRQEQLSSRLYRYF